MNVQAVNIEVMYRTKQIVDCNLGSNAIPLDHIGCEIFR